MTENKKIEMERVVERKDEKGKVEFVSYTDQDQKCEIDKNASCKTFIFREANCQRLSGHEPMVEKIVINIFSPDQTSFEFVLGNKLSKHARDFFKVFGLDQYAETKHLTVSCKDHVDDYLFWKALNDKFSFGPFLTRTIEQHLSKKKEFIASYQSFFGKPFKMEQCRFQISHR
jgi:hypothetical protein